MKTIWKVSYKLDSGSFQDMFFENFDLIGPSIGISFSQWIVKPVLEKASTEYACWRVADGSAIEAYAIIIYDKPTHL